MNSSATSALKSAFEKLFDGNCCAVRGCDRRPAKGSRLCGCHLDDRRACRIVVFRGTEEKLSTAGERSASS